MNAEEIEVWPENWAPLQLFADLATQWRVGMGGPIGLDYGVIPAVLRLRGVPRGEWAERFEALRVMERAALEEISESAR